MPMTKEMHILLIAALSLFFSTQSVFGADVRLKSINLPTGVENRLDANFGSKAACRRYAPPAMELGPHLAPLGMRFFTEEMFYERYKNQIFVAEHGSWNRNVLIGYRIMMVTLKENRSVVYTVFAHGWLKGSKA